LLNLSKDKGTATQQWGNMLVRTAVVLNAMERQPIEVREKALRTLCQLAWSSKAVFWTEANVRRVVLASAQASQPHAVRLAALDALHNLSETVLNQEPMRADAQVREALVQGAAPQQPEQDRMHAFATMSNLYHRLEDADADAEAYAEVYAAILTATAKRQP
jgi:hypothetical protein